MIIEKEGFHGTGHQYSCSTTPIGAVIATMQMSPFRSASWFQHPAQQSALSLALHSLAQHRLAQHSSLTPTCLIRFPQLPGSFPGFYFYTVPPAPRCFWVL